MKWGLSFNTALFATDNVALFAAETRFWALRKESMMRAAGAVPATLSPQSLTLLEYIQQQENPIAVLGNGTDLGQGYDPLDPIDIKRRFVVPPPTPALLGGGAFSVYSTLDETTSSVASSVVESLQRLIRIRRQNPRLEQAVAGRRHPAAAEVLHLGL